MPPLSAVKEHTILQANGLELAYDEFGERKNPAIILIMGLGTQMIAWPESFCEDLASKGFRVIRFDNRDIGLSQKLEDKGRPNLIGVALKQRFGLVNKVPYRLVDMAADTIGVMDALDIDAAHLVGISMGGMIAQTVAGHFPKRTLSLTSIMSSSGHRSLPSASVKVTRQVFKRPGAESEAAYIERALKTWKLIGSPDYPVDEEVLRAKMLTSYRRSYYPAGAARHATAIVASGDRVKLLRRIESPTLVIHGKADQLVPVACGIHTAEQIKQSTLELFEGMGHNMPEALLPRFAELISNHAHTAAGTSQAA
ncbi:MAG: pimeloyl-ACP methyl ester carboxylesterase [Halioglobus sp.]|jgi:pimeloyl-ACP methyl ester carboxylesterase